MFILVFLSGVFHLLFLTSFATVRISIMKLNNLIWLFGFKHEIVFATALDASEMLLSSKRFKK